MVWLGNFLFLLFIAALVFELISSRWGERLEKLFIVPLKMVCGSKFGILGGAQLLLRRLFAFVLTSNVVGLLPYLLRIRSHLVFSIRFAFPF